MAAAFEGRTGTLRQLAEIVKDLSDDLSNLTNEIHEMPAMREGTFKYNEVREIGRMMVPTQATGDEEVSILETAAGNVFTVHGSFLEQDAGSLFDPYSGIELVFNSGVRTSSGNEYETNTGNYVNASEVEYVFP